MKQVRIKYERMFKHPLDQFQNYKVGIEIEFDQLVSLDTEYDNAIEIVHEQAAKVEADILEQFDKGRTIQQHVKEKYHEQ